MSEKQPIESAYLRVADAVKWSKLSRSLIYELIRPSKRNGGRPVIKSYLVEHCRVIDKESLRTFIETK